MTPCPRPRSSPAHRVVVSPSQRKTARSRSQAVSSPPLCRQIGRPRAHEWIQNGVSNEREHPDQSLSRRWGEWGGMMTGGFPLRIQIWRNHSWDRSPGSRTEFSPPEAAGGTHPACARTGYTRHHSTELGQFERNLDCEWLSRHPRLTHRLDDRAGYHLFSLD